jgi:hypothetical protein
MTPFPDDRLEHAISNVAYASAIMRGFACTCEDGAAVGHENQTATGTREGRESLIFAFSLSCIDLGDEALLCRMRDV